MVPKPHINVLKQNIVTISDKVGSLEAFIGRDLQTTAEVNAEGEIIICAYSKIGTGDDGNNIWQPIWSDAPAAVFHNVTRDFISDEVVVSTLLGKINSLRAGKR